MADNRLGSYTFADREYEHEQYAELTPVILPDETEVKVPASYVPSSYPPVGQQLPVNMSQLHTPVNMTGECHDYNTVSIQACDVDKLGPGISASHICQLKTLFRGLPKVLFINSVIKMYAGYEVRMDEVRNGLFEPFKEYDSFSLQDCQIIKRREKHKGTTLVENLQLISTRLCQFMKGPIGPSRK